MDANVRALLGLMGDHKLTRVRVAELCHVGESTVDSWLAPPGAASHRVMPDRHLELLRLKLQGGA